MEGAQHSISRSSVYAYTLLYYGLDACPVSSCQLRSLNYVVVACARKIFNVNSSEIAAECMKMYAISDIAETVMALRKNRFIKISNV